MKKLLPIILPLLFVASGSTAQAQEVYKFWVGLRDKAGCTYTLDCPSAYLGPRSLQRRQRQGIAVDSLDLPVSRAYLQTFRQIGFAVQNQSRWLNGVTLFAADSSLASVLDTIPFVDTVIFCEKSSVQAPDVSPTDTGPRCSPEPFGAISYYDSAYYGFCYPQMAQLRGTVLHQHGFDGRGIVIGVCDAGFPGVDTGGYFHSLRSDGRLLASRDFVWAGNNVYSVNCHGTKVLSLMASCLPGCFVGAAPKASYVLCRTENPMRETILEEYNWISAAEYLDSMGVDVITSSLGYFDFDDSVQSHTLGNLDGKTAPMSIAADIAVSRGMLVINAAGNNGRLGSGYLGIPADAERVLTVGSVDADCRWSAFSSYGPTSDQRVKPDVVALGENVPCVNYQGELTYSSGTSLATPIMAGMMACLWQRYPNLTPCQLCDSVRRWGSADAVADMQIGYGIPDFSRAVQSYLPVVQADADAARFKIWPNPSRDNVVVELPGGVPSAGAVLLFCDMGGREVMRLPVVADRMSVSLKGISVGVYCVSLVTSKASVSRKLLVK